VFYLASDNQGELYLSTDPWAAHKTRIAFEPEWAFPRTWTGPASGRTNQENISSPIRLEAGQLYFVEGLHKEGWGGDNFGAAWQIPGAPAPENGSSPIGSEFLARPGPGFDENAPVVRLFFPTNGTVLDSGSGIALAAYAQHPVEDLTNVEFFVDNVPLGRGLEVMGSRRYLYLLGWSNAPAGAHMIAAAASDSAGRTTTTTPVLVTVLSKPPGPGSFVNRTILRNSVRLVAEPESGVSVYAIEEQQPVGWSAGNIGQDGAFDQFTGKVKFGPFFDHQARTLTYDSVPPVGFVGIGHVSGKASADGLSTPITGDDQVSVVIPHPADSSPADWRMELDDVTAYAAAWRTGGVWRLEPEVIPIEYVTRAAALWRGGEQY